MKRSFKIISLFITVMLVVVGGIIGFSNINKKEEKISIIATNFPAYDFSRAVAGDKAEIKMLVKPGAETHDFEPTPQDVIDIKKSDIFIYTGGESDEWIEGILNDNDIDSTKLLKMMDMVKVVEEETVEGMETESEEELKEELSKKDSGEDNSKEVESEEIEYDEHVWTSVRNAETIVEKVKDKLVELSPENKAVFEENAKRYIEKLAIIDEGFQEVVKEADRKNLVFGDRFPLRYFVEDYGLEYFAAFPGCSEQTEASSRTIAFLVDKIKSENMPVVFKIEMSSGKIAETIANETGVKVLTFNSAHNISAEDFKSGVTYVEIMERNIGVLREALNESN